MAIEENSDQSNESMHSQSFRKIERLGHKKIIEELFKKDSSSDFLYPFLIKYQKEAEDINYHKVLISVPKKNFKKAVDRNLIKRKIKEIYRINKHLIYPANPAYNIAIIYTGKQILEFNLMQNKLIRILKRLPFSTEDY